MDGIVDKITEFIKEMLQGWVLTNLETMFTDVNDKVGTIATEVGQSPSTWNASIFNMIKTLSDNVMIPIAGMIISFVLVYELISMIIDKNNMHEFDATLTEKEVKSLLEGKKILVKNLRGKSGKVYDAYLQPNGIEDFSYTDKNGKEHKGSQYKFDMTFPKKKN